MNINWTWLLIGIALGFFVIPRLHAAVVTSRSTPARSA